MPRRILSRIGGHPTNHPSPVRWRVMRMVPQAGLAVALCVAVGCANARTSSNDYAQTPSGKSEMPRPQAGVSTHGGIKGDRTVTGTVIDVSGDQIKVNTGEVQPRFLPLNMAKEKGATVQKGDQLEITLNEQNLVVDFHPMGQQSTHKVIKGQLASPLTVGHDRAMIRTDQGTEEGFEIRPLARSKVAAIPVGVSAVFLIDEMNKIADATFGTQEAVERAQAQWQNKSPIKGAHQQIEGTVMRPLRDNRITIRTEDGQEQPFGVRDIAQGKLAQIPQGERIVLMIDQENQVIDVASHTTGQRGNQ
jgi:TusA-related sulfurtransferase